MLIIEPFIDDFEDAIKRFKNMMTANRVAQPVRFSQPFITVLPLPLEFGLTKWNAETKQTVTMLSSGTGNAFPTVTYEGSSVD